MHEGRAESAAPALELHDLHAFYGESHVLKGVDLELRRGIVTLLGRNGVGKTTTLRAIMGTEVQRHGSVKVKGREVVGTRPHKIARCGIGYVPEERGIFASLNVLENLTLPPRIQPGGMSLAEIYELFPNLRERLRSQGSKLSGGEQQMLAIARILRTGADVILLDEPTEGLAPVIVQQISRVLQSMRERGLAILLVEQNFHFAASVADHHYVLEEGRIVDAFHGSLGAGEMKKLQYYLGV